MKKVLGYLFLVLGILSTMSLLGNIMKLSPNNNLTVPADKIDDIPTLVILSVLSAVFFIFGIKWTRNKK